MKAILIFLLFPLSVFAQTLTGRVVGIADGDTFTLLLDGKDSSNIKVRLYGIDCPEKMQDYGTRAKQYTSDLIFGKRISVEQIDIDRYGRTVGIARVGKTNVNEALLRAGYAWHYRHYDKNPEWDKLEDLARRNELGLWQIPNPTAPWEFRRKKTLYPPLSGLH